MKTNTLRHYERLKSAKLIERVFSREGSSIHSDFISARYLIIKESDFPLKVGFSVSKRLYKKAHDRNLYKRWLRESYRTQKQSFLSTLQSQSRHCIVFFILNKKIETQDFHQFQSTIHSIMEKLESKIQKSYILTS